MANTSKLNDARIIQFGQCGTALIELLINRFKNNLNSGLHWKGESLNLIGCS